MLDKRYYEIEEILIRVATGDLDAQDAAWEIYDRYIL